MKRLKTETVKLLEQNIMERFQGSWLGDNLLDISQKHK